MRIAQVAAKSYLWAQKYSRKNALIELKTGESATIVKVMGHGGFRRRIMEMGFVRGQRAK